MSGTSRRLARIWVVVGLMCVIVAAGIVPSILKAQEQPAAPAAGAAAPAKVQPSMQQMSRAFRTLRMQATDATKNPSSLELISQFETAAVAAKAAVPALVAGMPAADQPAKITGYKKEMIKLIRQSLDAEEAFLANDNAKANEILTAMNATQTEGHAEYRPQRGGGARRGQ